MKPKRGWSRDFTPSKQGERTYFLNHIPVPLWEAVRKEAARQGLSMRYLILTLLRDWLARQEPPNATE